jgi:hypothetical protein
LVNGRPFKWVDNSVVKGFYAGKLFVLREAV